MGKLNFNNFKKYLKSNSQTDLVGINLSTPVVNSLGRDGFYSTFAHQISWGEGAEILGQTLTGETTQDLFNAIEKGVSYYVANAAIDEEQLGDIISSYITDHGVIPSVELGTSTYYTTAPATGYYISGISVSGHVISPIYNKVEEYEHPTASQMWTNYNG